MALKKGEEQLPRVQSLPWASNSKPAARWWCTIVASGFSPSIPFERVVKQMAHKGKRTLRHHLPA